MSSWDEQFLKPCPYCNGKITDHSYDRRIVFKCEPCSLYKDYPGLLQTKISPVPVPYVDKDGNRVDPKDVKNQEYYHQHAGEEAVDEFNKWVDKENLQKTREEKLTKIFNT
jgi:hypothetical protein